MNPIMRVALVALGISGAVSVALYWIGGLAAARSRWLTSVGKVFYAKKVKSLDSWPLSIYKHAAQRREHVVCYGVIALAILLKSVASFLIGPIAIVWLPMAMLIMPALVRAHSGRREVHAWATLVTVLQGASHLFAAASGFSLVWVWLIDERQFLALSRSESGTIAALLFTSLTLALAAAWVEVDGHVRRGYLDEKRI